MGTDGGPRNGADLLPLVTAAVAGDPSALESLLGAVWPDACHIARSVLHDRHLAEDAAQEACAQAMVGIGGLRRPEAFRAWFYRFVTRAALRRLRQVAREKPLAEIDEAAAAPSAERVERVEAAGRAELLDLRRAVRDLPPTYRLPVLLRYYYDLSDREVAQALGTSAGAIRVRLTVARRRLRAALREPPDPGYPAAPTLRAGEAGSRGTLH